MELLYAMSLWNVTEEELDFLIQRVWYYGVRSEKKYVDGSC